MTGKAQETAEKAEQADRKVAETMAPVRDSLVVRTLGSLSEIADQPPLITLSALTFAAGLLSGRRRLAAAGGRMLAAELLATAMKSAIKHRVDRTRPRVVDDGGAYRSGPGESDDSGNNSFPSGHTAGAVAVARAIAREYPAAGKAALATAGGIAAIQVPRLQHYPIDIAAGAAIGLAAEALVDAASRLLGHAIAAPEPAPHTVQAPLLPPSPSPTI